MKSFTGDIETWQVQAEDRDVCQLVALATLHGAGFPQIQLAADTLAQRVTPPTEDEKSKPPPNRISGSVPSVSATIQKLGAARYRRKPDAWQESSLRRSETVSPIDAGADRQEMILFTDGEWADKVLLHAWHEHSVLTTHLGPWIVELGRNPVPLVRDLAADAAGTLLADMRERAQSEILTHWMRGEKRFRWVAARALAYGAKLEKGRAAVFELLNGFVEGDFGGAAMATAALAIGSGLQEADAHQTARMLLRLAETTGADDYPALVIGTGSLFDQLQKSAAHTETFFAEVEKWKGWVHIDGSGERSLQRSQAFVELLVAPVRSAADAPRHLANLRAFHRTAAEKEADEAAMLFIAFALLRLMSLGDEEDKRKDWMIVLLTWMGASQDLARAAAIGLLRCLRLPAAQTEARQILGQLFGACLGNPEATEGLRSFLREVFAPATERDERILRPVVERWRRQFPELWNA